MLKDEQFISAHFVTSFIEIHCQLPEIWSFEDLWIKFLKWLLSLLTGFTPTAAANIILVWTFYEGQIQIWILVMWLITAFNQSWRMESTRRQIDIVTYQVRKIKAYTSLCLFCRRTNGTVWRTLSRDIEQYQSHDQLQIWNWWSSWS